MNYTTQSIRHTCIYNETQRLKQDNFPFQIKSPQIFWHRVTADDSMHLQICSWFLKLPICFHWSKLHYQMRYDSGASCRMALFITCIYIYI